MSKVMKTLGVLGMSAALVGGAMTLNPAPAEAGDAGKFVAGMIIGGAVGALANEAHNDYHRSRGHRRHYNNANWRTRKHVNWCYRHYKSYDEYDNTWVSYSGNVRQCRSPYWG